MQLNTTKERRILAECVAEKSTPLAQMKRIAGVKGKEALRRVRVPCDPVSPAASNLELFLNGHRIVLRVGDEVELPQPIAALLENAGLLPSAPAGKGAAT